MKIKFKNIVPGISVIQVCLVHIMVNITVQVPSFLRSMELHHNFFCENICVHLFLSNRSLLE